MDVGYRRVSSPDQNPDRQLENVALDKVFTDKSSGVTQKNRPAWAACLEFIREGDTLHVHSMDRLARSLTDLKAIVTDLTGEGVTVVFHKENLTFNKEKADPMSDLLLHVIGAVAEFERALIRERQREGIDLAMKKGTKWGRPRALTKEQEQEILRMVGTSRVPKAQIAKQFGVSRATIFRVIAAE
jgi:DNA invertase Pin-like site-specific DNA recombinase